MILIADDSEDIRLVIEENILVPAGYEARELPDDRVWALTSVALLVLGTAWLCSSLLTSPTIATCLGLAAPPVLVTVAVLWSWTTDPEFAEPSPLWFSAVAPAVGILAFAAGTIYYLRRTRP